jgi:hypothetical protein
MWKSMSRFALVVGLAPCAVIACGGRTFGQETPDGGDDGGACVTIDVTTYDRSCQQASDCISISAGTFCDGECGCGGATINGDGESRYESQLAQITQGDCFCPEEPAPQCLENVCTVCTGGANDPPACGDTLGVPDASTCVYIDLSDYPTGCQFDSDCTTITSGEICSGSCACGGSTINVSGQAEYDDAVQSLQIEGCPCPFTGEPRCIESACTLCGLGPNQPAGCEIEDAGTSGN